MNWKWLTIDRVLWAVMVAFVGWNAKTLADLRDDMRENHFEIRAELRDDTNRLDGRIDGLDTRLDSIDSRLSRIEGRLEITPHPEAK